MFSVAISQPRGVVGTEGVLLDASARPVCKVLAGRRAQSPPQHLSGVSWGLSGLARLSALVAVPQTVLWAHSRVRADTAPCRRVFLLVFKGQPSAVGRWLPQRPSTETWALLFGHRTSSVEQAVAFSGTQKSSSSCTQSYVILWLKVVSREDRLAGEAGLRDSSLRSVGVWG